MNAKTAKKIRKIYRVNGQELSDATNAMFRDACELPLSRRLILAYKLLIGEKEWGRK